MLARCPNCRATFSTDRTGQQNCPTCGKPLVVPEQAPVAAIDPSAGARFLEAPGDSKSDLPPGTPWERRPELPWHLAWFETVKLALFEPDKLFASARIDKTGDQIGFALLSYIPFAIIGQLLSRLLAGPQQDAIFNQLKERLGDSYPPWLLQTLESSQHPSAKVQIASFLFAPLIALAFLLLNALVTHFFAMIFGQNRKGFSATFTACAYATAPGVLCAIPACGSLIAVIWLVVLTGIGLKRTQGISAGGATAATLGPYLVVCCAGCAVLMLAISAGAHAIAGGN